MSRPKATRSTAAGRAYLALQAMAKRQRRPTDELLQLYALEGFLDRLSASTHARQLVLKGGVLLAAYELRRPTRDVDLQATRLANEPAAVLAVVKDIASVAKDDGLVFAASESVAEAIREADDYSGVRVSLACSLPPAKMVFHVDINVGDPIWPAPSAVSLPRLLGGQDIHLSGFPLPMVHAEKLVTAVQRGTANTRWRDFADIYLLSRAHPVKASELHRAIGEVARFRHADILPLRQVLEGYAATAQARWAAWRRKQLLDDRLPLSFAEVLEAVIAFADPALTGLAGGREWNPRTRSWE